MWPVLKQMPESRELCLLIYDEMQHICHVMYLVQFVPILEKIESVKKCGRYHGHDSFYKYIRKTK